MKARKILACLLSLALCLSLTPITALADDEPASDPGSAKLLITGPDEAGRTVDKGQPLTVTASLPGDAKNAAVALSVYAVGSDTALVSPYGVGEDTEPIAVYAVSNDADPYYVGFDTDLKLVTAYSIKDDTVTFTIDTGYSKLEAGKYAIKISEDHGNTADYILITLKAPEQAERTVAIDEKKLSTEYTVNQEFQVEAALTGFEDTSSLACKLEVYTVKSDTEVTEVKDKVVFEIHSADAYSVNSDTSVVTFTVSGITAAGTYKMTVTVDGVESQAVTLEVAQSVITLANPEYKGIKSINSTPNEKASDKALIEIVTEGNTITIKSAKACMVLTGNEDDGYKEIGYTSTNGEGYVFAFTESAAVTVILKGDVDEDGELGGNDALYAAEASVGNRTLSKLRTAAGDVDGEPGVKGNDALYIAEGSVGNRTFSWFEQPLAEPQA